MKRILLLSLLAGCTGAQKAGPLAVSGAPPVPDAVRAAAARIEDPLLGVTRARIEGQLTRAGDQKRAEFSGWVPLVPSGGETPDLGELGSILFMLRAKDLVLEAIEKAPPTMEWSREKDLYRGAAQSGAFLVVRMDERDRIVFVRAGNPLGRTESLEIRYEGATRVIGEMVVHSGADSIVAARWTAAKDGSLSAADFELQLPDGTVAGAIRVRILEVERK